MDESRIMYTNDESRTTLYTNDVGTAFYINATNEEDRTLYMDMTTDTSAIMSEESGYHGRFYHNGHYRNHYHYSGSGRGGKRGRGGRYDRSISRGRGESILMNDIGEDD